MTFEVGRAGAKSVIVGVRVTSVCPCSLEISDIGAHNQRAEVRVQLWQPLVDHRFIWLEDLISLVERCGSGSVHSVLKRADEKFVTGQTFRAPQPWRHWSKGARLVPKHARLYQLSVVLTGRHLARSGPGTQDGG